MAGTTLSKDTGEISKSLSMPFMYVEWKVPDNILLSRDTVYLVESPSFQFKDTTWCLHVMINDEKIRGWGGIYGPIDLFLVKKDYDDLTLRVSYRMGVKTVDGNTFTSCRGEGIFKKYVHRLGVYSVLSRLDICQQKLKLAPNGVVTFFYYFWMETEGNLLDICSWKNSKGYHIEPTSAMKFSGSTAKYEPPSTGYHFEPTSAMNFSFSTANCEPHFTGVTSDLKTADPSAISQPTSEGFNFGPPSVKVSDSSTTNQTPDQGTSKLLKDFTKLFISGEDTDVIIKVKDTEFRAHKNILRVRSRVFYSMFSHDMLERNTGTISISDCEPEAFEIFLRYLYNGSMKNISTDIVFDLYEVADKYDADELKLKCKEFMLSNISEDTVCDIIEHSLQYEDEELLMTATEFFTNNFKKIILTVKWQIFLKNNSTVANELLIKASNCYVLKKHRK